MGVRRKTAEEIEACVQQAVLEVQRLAVDGVAPRCRIMWRCARTGRR